MSTTSGLCSQRCREACHAAHKRVEALTSSTAASEETAISAEQLKSWMLAISMCEISEGEATARRELCLPWTQTLLSWALARLTRAEKTADEEHSAGLFTTPEELARYRAILLPRADVVLRQESASTDTWTRVAEKVRAAEQTATPTSLGGTVDWAAATSLTHDRTADSLIGEALLVANRDSVQPTWTPASAANYETAVSHRLTQGHSVVGDAAPALHSATLASLFTWHTTHCEATSAPRTQVLGRCVDSIAYVMVHKIQNGTVTRCYAPLPFLLDAVALTVPTVDAVKAGVLEQEGGYRFTSCAMNALLVAVQSLYDQQMRAVLKDFKKRSKSKAPAEATGQHKVPLPTYELLVTVIEPTMDVLRRERGATRNATPESGTLAADVRAHFASVFEKLLGDWLRLVVQQLRASTSGQTTKALEAERDRCLLWIAESSAPATVGSHEQA